MCYNLLKILLQGGAVYEKIGLGRRYGTRINFKPDMLMSDFIYYTRDN